MRYLTADLGVDRHAILTHLYKRTLNGQHYEDYFNGEKHSNETDAPWMMADSWFDDENVDSLKFKSELRKWLPARYDRIIEKLRTIPFENGLYRVRRVLYVPMNWLGSLDKSIFISLGEYWCFSDYEIYAMWADKSQAGQEIHIEALAPPAAVDWAKTIMANMDWISGDEDELRLIQGSSITVTSIDINDNRENFDFNGYSFIV
jgi:hypothetical protein